MNEYPNEPNQIGSQDDNELENQQPINKSYTPSNISKVTNLRNNIYRGTKKAANLVKNTVKAVGKVARNIMKVAITNPHILIAIIVILFILIVFIAVINEFKDILNKENIENSVSAIFESWNEDNMNEQQKLAKASYDKTGSLMDFSVRDLSKFKDDIENDMKSKSYLNQTQIEIYEALLTQKGSNTILSSERIVSPDDKVTLYEHMLNISKYDFNAVKWKRYGHGIDGEESPLKEDLELGVRYPIDQNETEYQTFSSLLKPYLLSHEVPMAFFSGLISDSNDYIDASINMPYMIVKYGLSDITVNRYDVQKYNLATYYRDYDYNIYYSSFNVSFTPQSDGTYAISYSGLNQNHISSGHVNTAQDENGQLNPMLETRIDDKSYVSYDNKYYIAEAQTFDTKITNTYKYTPYSQADVDNRVYADTTNVVEEYYNENIDGQNKVEFINMPLGSCKNVNDALYSISIANHSGYGQASTSDTGVITYTFSSGNYEVREGKTFNVNRTWEDKLSQTEKKEDFYTISDLIKYNENCSAGKISENEFRSDEKSVTYYNLLDESNKLNRIDFLNSNPNIYKEYLIRNAYAEYIGRNREALEQFCYYNLTKNWQELIDKYTTFPYAYGKTYNFNKTNSVTNSVSGVNLLKQYIHTFEGDGSYSGGGRFDENYNKVSNDEDAKYYKVYSANDGVHTVGYGVNMEQNASAFADYGIDVSTVNFGDYIDKEIVDQIEDKIIQGRIDMINGLTNGIELTEYQLHALVSHSYVAGNINYFMDAYYQYWNQENDDKYEELSEKYKDTPELASTIMSEINFDNGIFDAFFSFYNYRSLNEKYAGYATRQKSEYTLFSGGYYSTLKRFWSSSAGTPNGIQLVNGDTIDDNACLELEIWYEQNVFSGKFSAGTDLYGYKAEKATDSQNTDSKNAFNPEYQELATGSSYYQCPWWSRLRANMYLRDMGSDKLLKNATGHGKDSAEYAATQLGLSLNTSIDGIRPYSIISFRENGSETGHTAFVEAVTSEYLILSECSSGWYWNGISIVPKTKLTNSSSTYYFSASVCLTDAL